MPEVALEMDRVYKKFKKGEIYDSLRDLIPAWTKRMFGREKENDLEEKEFWALEDVCFQVHRAEAFGIIGPNGAGKSTILKLLSQIMKPTKGTLMVKGRLSALIEIGAGFHGDLTGRENIFLNGTILGMTRNEIKGKFDEIVEFSGLEDFIDTPVKRYSSGMYARLGFSVAAHVDPDILIVDEVLSVGDYAFQRQCLARMNSVINSGSTVIFVSHNLRAVSELCTRSLFLDHGKAVTIGPTNDVLKCYMDRVSGQEAPTHHKEAFISNVAVRNEQGESVQFVAGQKAWVDIEITARTPCQKMSISVYLQDKDYYTVFATSTERLGHDTFSLEPGEKWTCTFELTLHLARGSFSFGVSCQRYDITKVFDNRERVATIYVGSERDVSGAANLYPEVKTFGRK